MTGLTLTPQALTELLDEPHSFEFVESDAEELRVSVRHMNIVDFHEGMALSLAARYKAPHERLRLLQLAATKFHNRYNAILSLSSYCPYASCCTLCALSLSPRVCFFLMRFLQCDGDATQRTGSV